MNTAKQLKKNWDNLSETKRKKAEAVVKKYLSTCRRLGVLPDPMARVWLEAIETVELEERFPEEKTEGSSGWEPVRRYDVYTAPADVRV